MSTIINGTEVVCRLLGGSGHVTHRVARASQTPALLQPPVRMSAPVVTLRAEPLPLAA